MPILKQAKISDMEKDRTRKQVTVEVSVMVTFETDCIDTINSEEAIEHLASQMDYDFNLNDYDDDDIRGRIIETEILEANVQSETEIS